MGRALFPVIARLATLLFLAAAACTPPGAKGSGPEGRNQRIKLGAEVLLSDSISLVAGKRAGLLTNHTGRVAGESTIDLLAAHPEIELAALFSPEHGIRGEAEAGVRIESGVDAATGLPVHSLYGSVTKPTPEMLDGIDILLFDIQDVGARYYTYLSSMTRAMEAAGEAGIPFVVLDRPNPLGGAVVQGNVLDPEFSSFVGMYPIPIRHGLTAGEFARLAAGLFGVRAELVVVPMQGWSREMTHRDTGLPWVPPSPNLPSFESALHYPGSCLFEGTSLSVGRGTDEAFQVVGAPWLDSAELVRRLARLRLPDTRFSAARFTPRDPGDGKFGDILVEGVRFGALGPEYDPTKAALALLVAARELSGSRWEWREAHFDRLAGADWVREAVESGSSYEQLAASWSEGVSEYMEARRPYLLYP